MKKIILLALCLSFITSIALAQLYVRAGAGYAFPLAGQSMNGTTSVYDGSLLPYSGSRANAASTITYNIKNISFSSGGQAVLGLGYMFSDHVGCQLDAGFAVAPTSYTFSDNLTKIYYSSGSVLSNVQLTQQAAQAIVLAPSIVVQSGSNPWNIYARFGLALPLSAKINQELSIANAPGTGALTVDDLAFHVKTSFSLGFCAAAGVQYQLKDGLAVWGELNMMSLSLPVKESDFTNFTENGYSYPVTSIGLPPVVHYSKTAIIDSSGTTAPAYTAPFSNAGLRVGVTIRLSERKQKRPEQATDKTYFKRKKF